MDKTYRFRNHFCKVLEDNYICLLLLLGGIITLVSDVIIGGKLTGDAIISLLLCAIAIVVIIISIISWKKISLYIEGPTLVYEKNTLNKQTITINLKDVSNVNVSRNIFEAITGTRKVKLDVNSTAATEAEITMCLKKNEAELFESLVSRHEEKIGDSIIEDQAESVETVQEKVKVAGITEVLAHSFFSLKFFSMIAVSLLVGVMALFSAEEDEVLTIIDIGMGMGFMTGFISVIAGGVAFVKQFFAYYGFVADRRENIINVSYGVFNKHNFKMPVDKISAVVITSSFIGRIFNRAYIQIKCIGVGDEETEKSIITLSLSKERLHKELLRLLPEFLPEEMQDSLMVSRNDMHKEPPRVKVLYIVYGLIMSAFILLIGVCAMSFVDKQFAIIVVAIVILFVIYTILFLVGKYHTSGYLLCDNHIVLCNGVLSRTTTIVRYKTIETMVMSEGLLLKKLSLCRGSINIKASLVGEVVDICHIESEQKQELIDRYLG